MSLTHTQEEDGSQSVSLEHVHYFGQREAVLRTSSCERRLCVFTWAQESGAAGSGCAGSRLGTAALEASGCSSPPRSSG